MGIGVLNSYESCPVHHTKVDEDQLCPKCDKVLTVYEREEDFKVSAYIEVGIINMTPDELVDCIQGEAQESDVKEVLIFKRTLDQHFSGKLDNLINKKVIIDCNFDDADRLIVKFIEFVK